VHHALPDSGWVSYPIDPGDAGVEHAVELFRLAYERATAAHERRAPNPA
jgi:hypothetical protein